MCISLQEFKAWLNASLLHWTHWGRDETTAILQTLFLHSFPRNFRKFLYSLIQGSLKFVPECVITTHQHGCMMTSSIGNIFRVTGPLCGEFTGPGEFTTQRPVTRSFDVFFDRRLNKRLSKHSWGWWFETLSWSLRRHHNAASRGYRVLSTAIHGQKYLTKFTLTFMQKSFNFNAA